MDIVSEFDFLDVFGLEPEDKDISIGYFRYIKKSDCNVELDFSFSAILKSFQIIFRLDGKEIYLFSSESLLSLKLQQTLKGDGVYIEFNYANTKSVGELTLKPNVHFHYWSMVS